MKDAIIVLVLSIIVYYADKLIDNILHTLLITLMLCLLFGLVDGWMRIAKHYNL